MWRDVGSIVIHRGAGRWGAVPQGCELGQGPPPEGGPGPGTQGGKDGVERGGSGYTGEGARRSMIPGVTSNPSGSLVDSLVNCLFSWNYV